MSLMMGARAAGPSERIRKAAAAASPRSAPHWIEGAHPDGQRDAAVVQQLEASSAGFSATR